MKKITFICALLLLISSLFSQVPLANERGVNSDKDKYLYLIVGFDDAAENTDVIFTLGVDLKENTAYVAQIPRDTYFNFGGAQNKVNQIYAMNRLRGDEKNTAMRKTSDFLSESFGVDFDGFVGISVGAFKDVVDAIGGVDISLSKDLVVQIDGDEPITLKAGNNHISGDVAEKFVRYRKGYATGDLGRIDAQKLFINAIFAKVSSGVSLSDVASVAFRLRNDIVTDLKISDILPAVFRSKRAEEEKKTFFATVPGAAAFSNSGLSYYVINKAGAAKIARDYMFSSKEFDPNRKFLNPSYQNFVDIYESDNIKINEFSNQSLSDVGL